MRTSTLILAAMAILTTAAVASAATDFTWTTTNGTWSTPGNWTPAGPPGDGDNVIRNGATVMVLDVDTAALGSVSIDVSGNGLSRIDGVTGDGTNFNGTDNVFSEVMTINGNLTFTNINGTNDGNPALAVNVELAGTGWVELAGQATGAGVKRFELNHSNTFSGGLLISSRSSNINRVNAFSTGSVGSGAVIVLGHDTAESSLLILQAPDVFGVLASGNSQSLYLTDGTTTNGLLRVDQDNTVHALNVGGMWSDTGGTGTVIGGTWLEPGEYTSANITAGNPSGIDLSSYITFNGAPTLTILSNTPIPEPATLAFLGLGGLAMAGAAIRRRRA